MNEKFWFLVIASILLIVTFVGSVSAVAPAMSQSIVNSTTGNIQSNLSLFCVGEDVDGDRLLYNYSVFKNGGLNFSGNGGVSSCLQFSPNVSNSSCLSGGLGGYNANWNDVFDGNLNTYKDIIALSGQALFFNYSKPKGFVNGSRVVVHNDHYLNDSGFLLNSCFLYNSSWVFLKFNDTVDGGFDGQYVKGVSCFNGTWNELFTVTSGSESYFYIDDIRLTWDLGFVQNVSVNVGNVSSSLLRRGDNWSLECRAFDGLGYSGLLNSSSILINDTAPSVSSVFVVNASGGVNTSYNFSDVDGDVDASFFRWFKNNVSLNITSRFLGGGNFSLLDGLIVEVTPGDGTLNGSSVNSSVYFGSDSTLPSLGGVVLPVSAFTDEVVNIRVSCVDENGVGSGYPLVRWVNPNGITEGFFSMSSFNSSVFEKNYTFSIVGAYSSFLFSCRDGSGNEVNLSSGVILSVSVRPVIIGGGGGGGGGGTIIVPPSGGNVSSLFSVETDTGSSNPSLLVYPGKDRLVGVMVKSLTGNDLDLMVRCEGSFCSNVRLEKSSLRLRGGEVNGFFVNVTVPKGSDFGDRYLFDVIVSGSGQSRVLKFELVVSEVASYLDKLSFTVSEGDPGHLVKIGDFNVPKILLYLTIFGVLWSVLLLLESGMLLSLFVGLLGFVGGLVFI